MDIFIHPRIEISKIAPSKPYAVISITDEGNDFAPIFVSPNLKDVLRCHFDDIAQHYPGYTVFDAAMAARIWAFVDQLESIEELHINCEAGRSRSAAVAAAICLYKNGVGSDSWVWNEQWRFGIFKYSPNLLVYGIMTNMKGLTPTVDLGEFEKMISFGGI